MDSVKNPVASEAGTPPAKKIRGQHTASSSDGRHRRLRCPFIAKFPEKHRASNSSCNKTGFMTSSRLIEHLKRAHGPVGLKDGAVDPEAVTLPSPEEDMSVIREGERVTIEQLALIAKLPRNPNAIEKWGMIYKIIFPSDEADKPLAYMQSAEQLRDYARDRPDWLVTKLAGAIGISQRDVIILMDNFLIFFDVVGGSQSTLPPFAASSASAQPERSSMVSENFGDTSLVGGTGDGTGHWHPSSLPSYGLMPEWTPYSYMNNDETYVFTLDDSIQTSPEQEIRE